MQKSILIIGALFIVTAIIFGAFGAHALKEVLTQEKLVSFETGVRYQLIQGLALLFFGMHAKHFRFEMKWIVRLLITGTLLFAVSIYLLATNDLMGISMKWLGPVTPIGGLFMIIGWFVFLYKLIF